MFQEHNLVFRWKLKNHPLYEQANCDLGITIGDTNQQDECEGSRSISDQIFAYDQKQYIGVKFLDTENARYIKLKEQFDKAARLAKCNKENYRKMLLNHCTSVSAKAIDTASPKAIDTAGGTSGPPKAIVTADGTPASAKAPGKLVINPCTSGFKKTQGQNQCQSLVLQEIHDNCFLPPNHKQDGKKRGRVSQSQVENLAKHKSKKKKGKHQSVRMTF
jgi:hypothetical protein